MIRNLIKKALGPRLCTYLRKVRNLPYKQAKPFYEYQLKRLVKYSGAFATDTRGKALARLIMTYHIVEKGLTMPNRRFTFGQQIILDLIAQINRFELLYGSNEPQVDHAIGVLKAYWELHEEMIDMKNIQDDLFWNTLCSFLEKHSEIPVARQPHFKRQAFYEKKEASFPEFAAARHTLRHYAPTPLSMERIEAAVQLALNTPTACNRQYCRVHCVSDKTIMEKLLELQSGNRGFGHLADKLLIVTADLQGLQGVAERDDLFTNGGMFLMNLCYGLYYNEIAHCILNWSKTPETDIAMRKLIPIPEEETVVALLTCGETPEEFDVAASPRRSLSDICAWKQ